MIWHWKIAETLARKFKQQFKQLSVHFYFAAFFWKTGLLILTFKCDIYAHASNMYQILSIQISLQYGQNIFDKL